MNRYRPDDKGATAFPASILVGSSFNPQLAREEGVAIGREARIRGFNIMLAGGMNLARDVRNDNFEYYSEDPFHTAVFAAEAVNGIQRQKRHLDAQALHAQLHRRDISTKETNDRGEN